MRSAARSTRGSASSRRVNATQMPATGNVRRGLFERGPTSANAPKGTHTKQPMLQENNGWGSTEVKPHPLRSCSSRISEVDLQPILDFARPMVLGDLSVAGIARIGGVPCGGVQRLAETRTGIIGDVGSIACQNAV